MELSIIITSYRNPELLKVCIDSIKKKYTGTDYEIIVSDSATEEKTAMMMRDDYADVKFLPSQKNIGFSGTVNRGLENAQGKYVLILNGDIIVKNGAIEKMLAHLQAHPEIGIIGPQLLNFNDSLQLSTFRFYSPLTILYRRTIFGEFWFAKKHLDWFAMKNFDGKSIKEVDWMMGSSLMAPRKAIDEVGPMDDRFKMYFEDTDWCRRFWDKGYKVIYFPDAQMYHYHGRGSKDPSVLKSLLFNRLAWLHILSALKFFRKYQGKPLPKHN